MDAVKFAELVAGLNVDELLFQIYKEPKTQAFIIGLNTRDQLFVDREDSDGRDLGDKAGGYSPVTEELNEGVVFQYQGETNQKIAGEAPFLFDTGTFFGSWVVIPTKGGFIMDADPMRGDTNLFNDYGENIVGLTNESLQLLQEFLLQALAEKVETRFEKVL